MTDTDGLDEAFKGFGEDPAPVTPTAPDPATPDDATPPADPAKEEPAKKPEGDEDVDKDKPSGDQSDDTTKPSEEKPTPSDSDKPVDPEEKPEDGKEAKPVEPETPQPLTKDDVQEVVSNLLSTERNSTKELDTTTTEVLEAYYPDGLSNTLIDEQSGKELKTPQDVVDASGGEMTTEQAAQWLMNEQFKLDKEVSKIKEDARRIAETTVNFKRDAVTAVQKYEPLFKAYPIVQQKVYDLMMKQVKIDEKKNVVLSAPDVIDLYDTYLEPYQKAFEYANKTSATNPTAPATPEPPKPSAEDRMDEGGDGGSTPPNDPNDFAQQVTKELAKGI